MQHIERADFGVDPEEHGMPGVEGRTHHHHNLFPPTDAHRHHGGGGRLTEAGQVNANAELSDADLLAQVVRKRAAAEAMFRQVFATYDAAHLAALGLEHPDVFAQNVSPACPNGVIARQREFLKRTASL